MRIVATPLIPGYIDLDAISVISDVRFVERPLGWATEFDIHLKLHEKPLVVSRKAEPHSDGETLRFQVMGDGSSEGQWIPESDLKPEHHPRLACVIRMQAEVAKLVKHWRGQPTESGPGAPGG